jgi:hypothetical protein
MALSLSAITAAADGAAPFANPLILKRADPYIYLHTDGYYYFCASVPEYDRIELSRARDIVVLESSPKALRDDVVQSPAFSVHDTFRAQLIAGQRVTCQDSGERSRRPIGGSEAGN